MAGLVLVFASQQAGAVEPDAPDARPGAASANGSVFSIAVQSGGTAVKPSTAGRASAAYVETQTQATSATVDLGGVGYLLTAIPICGQVLLPSSRQPQPLTASSADGADEKTTSGNLGGVGTQSVRVSPSPQFATAITKPISQSLLGGLVQIDGTATSTVRYDGQQQRADSSVSANLGLAGGLVRIEGMKWVASQHTGRGATEAATFSFGTVIIGRAAPITLPSGAPADAVVGAINTAVSPFGLRLSLPVDASDAATATTAIGPLQIHVAGSKLDSALVTPAAEQLAQLEAIVSGHTTNGTDCSDYKNLFGNLANPGVTFANIGVGILQGAGSLDLGLGGAVVSTQPATDFANPFARSGSASGNVAGTTASRDGLPGGDAALDGVAAPLPAAGAPTVAAGDATATSAGALRCITRSPAGRPGCWSGLGPAVGALTTAGAAAMLAADLVFSRRAHRRRRRRGASA